MTANESSHEWQIKLIEDWQFFATLTWNPHKDMGTLCKRRNDVMYWLRKIAREGKTTEEKLCYVTRWESGELGGLLYCYFLIVELLINNYWSCCFFFKALWEKGLSQVRLYNPGKALGAAAYMTKGKFSAAWAQGANGYEVAKFGSPVVDSIYFSKRARERMMQRRANTQNRAIFITAT
jgi:hypothetical protein